MKRSVAQLALVRPVFQADFFADCGNSSTKIAAAESGPLSVQTVQDKELAEWAASQSLNGQSVLILAGNLQRSDLLTRHVKEMGATVRLLNDNMQDVNCAQYAGMGADRVCAGIAAISIHKKDLIVIDAGTMLTLSAWRYDDKNDFNSAFIGGFIFPGPQACLDAMPQAAPALPQLELISTDKNFGSNTIEHLQTAITYGWPAAAGALVAQLQEVLPAAPLICTGGNKELLPFDDMHMDEALVLRGMQIIANGS